MAIWMSSVRMRRWASDARWRGREVDGARARRCLRCSDRCQVDRGDLLRWNAAVSVAGEPAAWIVQCSGAAEWRARWLVDVMAAPRVVRDVGVTCGGWIIWWWCSDGMAVVRCEWPITVVW
ncbi:hypothetical protein TNCV_5111271 [Trichonephila clavipes]|nr:hypothetical protein TNCV_5111271 [Trichonephila clavipes]